MPNKVILPFLDPGDPTDILIPMSRIFLVPVNPQAALKQMISDMPYMLGGRASKPGAPIVIRMIDGSTTILPGFGVTEAAELQDMAYRQLEKKHDNWRDRFGFDSEGTFDSRVREHMDWRNKHPQDHPKPMTQLERESRRRQIPLG